MDVNDPSSSPSGAQFIPQLPPLGTEPIQPFSDSLELEHGSRGEMPHDHTPYREDSLDLQGA